MRRCVLVALLLVACVRPGADPAVTLRRGVPAAAALLAPAAGTTLTVAPSGRFVAAASGAAAGAGLGVQLGARYRDGLIVTAPGGSAADTLTLRPELGDSALVPGADGVARYQNVAPGVDALIAVSEGLAEEIVLVRDLNGPHSLAYRLERGSGLTGLRVSRGEVALSDAAGRTRLVVRPPVIFDAAGRRVAGRYDLDGDRLLLSWPPEGLHYPIAVDPAITTSTGPRLGLSVVAHDFSGQPNGQTSAPFTVMVINVGSSAVNVTGVSSSSANFAATPVGLTQGLEVGDSFPLEITYTASGGTAAGTISFTTNDPSPPTISLTGFTDGTRGSGPYPANLYFANVPIGDSATLNLDYYGNPFPCASVTSSDSHFVLGFSCSSAGGATYTPLPVIYTPTGTGGDSSTITITPTIGTAVTATVHGTGGQPTATLDKTSIAFGTQREGTASSTKTAKITNSGNSLLIISSSSVTGANAADFTVMPASATWALLPNDSVTWTITFTPSTAEAESATLTFVSDDGSTPTVSLTGTGTFPVATYSTTALAFGNQLENTMSAAQTFTITNTGTDTLNFGNWAVTGANAGDFTVTPATTALAVNAVATWSVTFKPTTAAAETAVLTINTDDGAQAVVLSGTGTYPAVSVSPAAINFGTQLFLTTSAPQTVTVTNTGTSPLVLAGYTLTAGSGGTNLMNWTVSPASAATTIPAGGSSIWTITFTPNSNAAQVVSMTFTSAALTIPTVTLTGTGITPILGITPGSINFANTVVGVTSAFTAVTISNTGSSPLHVTGYTVTGNNAADFLVSPSAGATIAAGRSAQWDVQFKPSISGAESATLGFATDNGNPTVSLSGTGVAPVASPSLTAINFGGVRRGTTSAVQNFSVTNTGTSVLHVFSASWSGTNAADFTFLSPATLPFTLANSTTLAGWGVDFSPGTTGAEAATLTIITDGGNIAVTATGVGTYPGVSVSPATLPFGNLRTGKTTSQSVVLTNDGTSTLNVSGYGVTGTNRANFTVSPLSGPSTIAPGATETWTVTFVPSTPLGVETATLTFGVDSGLTSPTVPLSGTAVFPAASYSPGSVAFGTQRTGTTSASTNLTITNTGTDTLNIASYPVNGTNGTSATDFAVSPTSGSIAVAPGNSTTLSITFSPHLVGAESGVLTVNTDAGNQTINLSGTGIFPQASLSTTALSFGNQRRGTTSSSQTVTVTNNGTATLNLSNPVTSGTNAADFTLGSNFGAPALAPSQTATVTVTFAPSLIGSENATLTITSDNGPLLVSLTGVGTFPAGSISTSVVTFNNQRKGTASTAQPVTLTNSGTDTLHWQAAALTGTNAADFSVSPTSTGTLAPGADETWNVQFKPSALGAESATLTLNSDGGNFTVSLSGTSVFPSAVLSTGTIAFGSVRDGTTAAHQVSLSNLGTDVLNVTDVAVSGTNATDFVAALTAGGTTVATGSQSTWTVTFTPSMPPSSESALLTFTTDNGPLTVTLSGTGIFPQTVVSPATVAFGSERTGTTTSPLQVSIQNTGTALLNVSGFTLSGQNPADFAVTPASVPTTVASGATARWAITFTPSAKTAESATLVFQTDNGSESVSLTGTGIFPAASVAPTSVNFGNQPEGVASTGIPFTISNFGTDTLHLTSITLSGTNAADFALSSTTTPVTVPAANNLTWTVTFKPSISGSESALVTFQGDTGPLTVMLAGTGTQPDAILSQTSINFGNEAVGAASMAELVTITNVGNASVQITGYSQSGSPAFSVSPASASTVLLPATVSSPWLVTFQPTSSGSVSGVITFQTNDGPLSVTLAGTGIAPVAKASVTNLVFANQREGTISPAQTVTITNTGTSVLHVVSTSVSGPNASDFTVSSSVPTDVPPSGTPVTLSVIFTPSTAAHESATLQVQTDGGGATVSLTGTGIFPLGTASPGEIIFFNQPTGTTSPPISVTVTNSGTDVLNVAGFSLSGANATDFQVSPASAPTTIAVNASVVWNIVFTPKTAAEEQATLTFQSDNGLLPVGLSGQGTTTALSASPTAVDFGDQRVDSGSVPATITLTNSLSMTVHVTGVSVTGVNASDFATSPPSLPIALSTGGMATISVTFTPGAIGARSATLVVMTDNALASASVPLAGTGISPSLAVTPAQIAFGNVRVEVSSPSMPITISNQGNDAVNVETITLSGQNASEMTLQMVPSLPAPIAAGGSLTIGLTYLPTAIEASMAMLSITTDDPLGGALTLNVTGQGVSPNIETTTTALSFGGVRVGTPAPVQFVTITNLGGAVGSVDSLQISGGNLGDFSLVDLSTPPIVLPAGNGTLTFAVQFTPQAVGARTSTLALTVDAVLGPSPINVTLSGTGLSPTLGVSPMSLDFGTLAVGSGPHALTVTVTNGGTDALRLLPPSITGAGAAAYAVTFAPPMEPLVSGQSVTLTVQYTPIGAGSSAATLVLTSADTDAATAQVGLTAVALSPLLTASPTSISFPVTEAGTRSQPISLTLTNTSTAAVQITDLRLAATDFLLASVALPIEVPVGQSVTLSVGFEPQDVASTSGSLQVFVDDGVTPAATVMLSGGGSKIGGGCITGGATGWAAALSAVLALRRRRSSRERRSSAD